MSELRLLVELVIGIVKLIAFIVRGVFRLCRGLVRWIIARARASRVDGPGAAPAPVDAPAAAAAAARPAVDRVAVDRVAVARVMTKLQGLATQARALDARCSPRRLCAPLLPTLRDFILPRLAKSMATLSGAPNARAVARIASGSAYLEALTQLLSLMADQRCDPDLEELIDDADALAAACYRPVVDYCRTNDVPLSSDRTAAMFGDGCSPWLGRIDDPTGLALLHLPWQWLAEVHRWPAIGHEVGHDFYDSVAGLDAELMKRVGLAETPNFAKVIDGDDGVTVDDVDRIVTRWRRELTADAFGVMMLGPAYAVTTAAIFASPADPAQALAVQVDGDEYEVHPPGHVRVAAVCRLLVRMGYGALGETMERRWRSSHGNPEVILLPTASGYLRVDDQPFIDSAVTLTGTLQREGFAALRGIPLYSMPGFDFGPREHAASLRIRDAFLAGGRPRPTDARLLIAGAVLAWAERPADGVRLLRAARLAVGTLDLPVPRGAAAGKAPPSGSLRELVRDAVLLDVLLTPPRASLLRR